MEEHKMRCPICENTSEWKNVDQYRFKPSGMCLCLKCGFVSYPSIVNQPKDLEEYYREEYRDVPTVHNVFAGQRKLHYHHEFLSELLTKWKKEGFAPRVCEIGAAFGMFLHWFKTMVPKAEIHGTELTESFVRNAYWKYGIRLKKRIDTSLKYDFIASYKVAEHIPDMDKELRKYAECLSDQGVLYISVPCWFGSMTNFGTSGFNLEYYYHKNHVNVWTRKLFETLLKKAGLEIIKENHVFYDSTYLCKRNDALMAVVPEYENPEEIENKMKAIKAATMAFDASQFEEAVKHWPDFPDAHIGYYESRRQHLHKQGFEEIHNNYLVPALEACSSSSALMSFVGDVCMRYDQWDLALSYLDQALKMRPNDPSALMAIGHCLRQKASKTKDPKAQIELIKQARDLTLFLEKISFQTAHEAITWVFNDNARLPIPDETVNSS